MPSAVSPFRVAARIWIRDLPVEVSRRQALTEQFYTLHLGFDAASAVVLTLAAIMPNRDPLRI
jgi:hypothetical protein